MIKVTDKAAKKLKELRELESYSNDYNVRAKASSLSSTDEGLRKFMLKVVQE